MRKGACNLPTPYSTWNYENQLAPAAQHLFWTPLHLDQLIHRSTIQIFFDSIYYENLILQIKCFEAIYVFNRCILFRKTFHLYFIHCFGVYFWINFFFKTVFFSRSSISFPCCSYLFLPYK